MAIRNIREEGDEILRKTSREVSVFDEKLATLIDDMYDTMYQANGVGLAAVQVGILKRVVVVDTREEGEKLELVNPAHRCVRTGPSTGFLRQFPMRRSRNISMMRN